MRSASSTTPPPISCTARVAITTANAVTAPITSASCGETNISAIPAPTATTSWPTAIAIPSASCRRGEPSRRRRAAPRAPGPARASRARPAARASAPVTEPIDRSDHTRGRGARPRGPAAPSAERSRLEPVADAPDRLDVTRPRRVGLDLRAQPAHVHRHSRRVAVEGVLPDRVHQLRARERLARMAREEQQQVELALRQRDLVPARRTRAAPPGRSPGRRCSIGGAFSGAGSTRRSTASTRATSSAGENGLTT